MKILTYKHGGETAVGVLKNDGSEVCLSIILAAVPLI